MVAETFEQAVDCTERYELDGNAEDAKAAKEYFRSLADPTDSREARWQSILVSSVASREKQVMMGETDFPWGAGDHEKNYGIDKDRVRCFDCDEWCYPPQTDHDLEFVCKCCREPLYQLHIAELESKYAALEEDHSYRFHNNIVLTKQLADSLTREIAAKDALVQAQEQVRQQATHIAELETTLRQSKGRGLR